jgi:hypothetical protein
MFTSSRIGKAPSMHLPLGTAYNRRVQAMFGVGKLERALMPDIHISSKDILDKSLIVRNPDKDWQRSATSYERGHLDPARIESALKVTLGTAQHRYERN